mmetsp:Transcript_90048/g.232406  ORF Transcript_90048/g.232406 Transcript_90048/m.232406 type:complete len:258 (+) Transcript_90048:764-1537(+)
MPEAIARLALEQRIQPVHRDGRSDDDAQAVRDHEERASELRSRLCEGHAQVHLARLLLVPELHRVVEGAEGQVGGEQDREQPQEASHFLRRECLGGHLHDPVGIEARQHHREHAHARADEGGHREQRREAGLGHHGLDNGHRHGSGEKHHADAERHGLVGAGPRRGDHERGHGAQRGAGLRRAHAVLGLVGAEERNSREHAHGCHRVDGKVAVPLRHAEASVRAHRGQVSVGDRRPQVYGEVEPREELLLRCRLRRI